MASIQEPYSHRRKYAIAKLRLDLNTRLNPTDVTKVIQSDMLVAEIVHQREGTRGFLRCGNLKVTYLLREGKSGSDRNSMCIISSNAGNTDEEANKFIVKLILPVAVTVAKRYNAELFLPDWLLQSAKWR